MKMCSKTEKLRVSRNNYPLLKDKKLGEAHIPFLWQRMLWNDKIWTKVISVLHSSCKSDLLKLFFSCLFLFFSYLRSLLFVVYYKPLWCQDHKYFKDNTRFCFINMLQLLLLGVGRRCNINFFCDGYVLIGLIIWN